ncbi:hypothetical protein [Kitasatospora camelliae]|uniref:Uncharacterized protein n=1 Tax=Kitasatospora camelliae TaxID=3156397 RepID=A0AAU8JN34_9ACTN
MISGATIARSAAAALVVLAVGAGAPAAVAAPVPTDSPAPAAVAVTAAVTAPAATWRPTGEAYRTRSACEARRSYFMAASNVYDYDCRKKNGWYEGWVKAD